MTYLLDTNICIYCMRHNPPAVRQRFENLSAGDVAISSITVAELEYGVAKSRSREQNAEALEAFLLPLDILPFDAAASYNFV